MLFPQFLIANLIVFIPRYLVSKITGDADIRSSRNDFWALSTIFILIVGSFFLCMILVIYPKWKSIEHGYTNVNSNDHQAIEHTLALLTKGGGRSHHYRIKLKLDDTGFYFLSPSEYRHELTHIKSPKFHTPLFIPWSAITQCENSYNSKITLKIKNSETLIQLRLWSFLKPMCQEKGIKIIDPTENK